MTISYTVERGKTGWNVIRRDSETGDKRPVVTKHSEHAAHLAAQKLQQRKAK